jgi:branched-chain amino acid transport system ATP-binding protein
LPLLQVDEITVRFGGVTALSDVQLDAEQGSITGLIGPNGAGKTTLFNVITGLQEPTSGKVTIDAKDVTGLGTHKRARMGVARTFQRLEVFGSLTARENVLVAAEIRKRWAKDRSANCRSAAAELLDRVGISHVAEERVDALSTGYARLVELARALATQPRLLLLDEPGSGLDSQETEVFGDLLLELARDGLTILLVEHDVELVMRVCDRIHVLDFGRKIAVGSPAEIQADPQVQAAYLGEDESAAPDEDAARPAPQKPAPRKRAPAKKKAPAKKARAAKR